MALDDKTIARLREYVERAHEETAVPARLDRANPAQIEEYIRDAAEWAALECLAIALGEPEDGDVVWKIRSDIRSKRGH